jgi:hypothetical protein
MSTRSKRETTTDSVALKSSESVSGSTKNHTVSFGVIYMIGKKQNQLSLEVSFVDELIINKNSINRKLLFVIIFVLKNKLVFWILKCILTREENIFIFLYIIYRQNTHNHVNANIYTQSCHLLTFEKQKITYKKTKNDRSFVVKKQKIYF